eukprot:CAMPEP_0196134194 /NCGR_PEP_ID=MMETSP0910-20130528/3152_1 /TAXON_ID=49265 /ORGANISM="Thalassiosira rotula, Strain GSO102" /LENGTH=884 /DNA_ID=CAMNT_0041394043 /DNA_START=266 /DNA_END=2920 /DNA_ORIENTATION=+
MKNTNKITVVIRPMMRPKLLSCGCFLAILLSGSCNNPPLSLLSSSSIVGSNGSFVVSGELQPASSSSSPSSPSSSSLLSPPPRRRRGASSPAFFFPPGSRTKYHKKRRKGDAIGGGGDNKPFSISTVLGVRCGGAAADDDNEEANNGEQGDVEGDSVAGIDDLSSEPLVDVSIIENEESAVINDGKISSIAELETSESESEESDSTGAQDDVDVDDDDNNDYDFENKESDTTEKTISNPIDISDDDVSSDSDEETNNGESSDPDIPDSSITSSQTATIPDDDDDDNNNNNAAELVRKQSILRSSASDRRAEAKALHDEGNLSDAAHAFREAASLLDEAASLFPSSGLSEEDDGDGNDNERIAVERATCRLHEALCLFKDGRPGECVEACSDVLEDGVTVVAVPSEEEEDGGNDVDGTDGEDATPAKDKSRTDTTSVIRIAPTTTTTTSSPRTTIPPQIRARAHHRRAKARLALGDLEGALEDARSAAFMGDRNAVQFYGRLMREGSGAASSSSGESMPNNGGFGNLPFGLSEGPGARGAGTSSSNSFLEGMLEGMGGAGNNPLMPSGSAGSSGDFSSSLLSSLMTGGANDGGNPLGLLGDLLAPPETTAAGKSRRKKKMRGGGGGGGMDGLAKSVLSSLVKRIEDEETQETICRYLRSTNTQQIMSFAAMAGVPMKEESARRLVGFANGVTPKGIGKSVSKVKRGISIVKTVRKILKVIDKYKAYIILAVLCYWIRSAVTEPYPIGKKEARKLAQKAAFGAMIAPCRGGGSGRSLGNLCGGVVRALGTLYSSGNENNGNNDDGASTTSIEGELERLQNQLFLIEAIEERNRAQLDSFVDEEDQWDSLEEDERVLLRSKDVITQEMESLTEQLVMLFMGQKMMDG